MQIDREAIAQCARNAGAAKFYPEQQAVVEQNYVVSAGFLERFAQAIAQAIAQRAAEAERARCAAMARAFKDHGYDYTGDLELHEAIASGFDSGAQGEQA